MTHILVKILVISFGSAAFFPRPQATLFPVHFPARLASWKTQHSGATSVILWKAWSENQMWHKSLTSPHTSPLCSWRRHVKQGSRPGLVSQQ